MQLRAGRYRCICMLMPAADEIHMWYVRNQDANADAHLALLSADEKQRMARLQVASMRQQFVVTRASVRTILSFSFPEIAATDWVFDRNPWGRPGIANPEAKGRVSFNIAHTDGLIVIALSGSGEVGVDVERDSRETRALALADRYFSASEAAALRASASEDLHRHFLDLWTLKEAYIKACGKGLAMPLRSISFTLNDADLRVAFDEECADDPLRWQFWQLALGEAHHVGLALVDAALPEVSLRCCSLIDLQPGPLEELRIIRQSMRSQERMYSRTNLEP